MLPQSLTISLGELASAVKEGLLAFSVGVGLEVVQLLMEEDVTVLAGVKGRHDPARSAVRHGYQDGSVTLGGRRVPLRRPRVRTADNTAELPVATYEQFTRTDLLGAMALERMLAGLSTRDDRVGLEPVGTAVTERARATSRSAAGPPVCGPDPDRAGRAAGRGPVGDRPGRDPGRRGGLCRAAVRGRAGRRRRRA
jgi:hypothetical protein